MSTADRTNLDLSPTTFDRLVWGGRCLVIEPPLTLTPRMDEESGRLYILVDETLNIHVLAESHEQLAHELAEQLIFQWDTDQAQRTRTARTTLNRSRNRRGGAGSVGARG